MRGGGYRRANTPPRFASAAVNFFVSSTRFNLTEASLLETPRKGNGANNRFGFARDSPPIREKLQYKKRILNEVVESRTLHVAPGRAGDRETERDGKA